MARLVDGWTRAAGVVVILIGTASLLWVVTRNSQASPSSAALSAPKPNSEILRSLHSEGRGEAARLASEALLPTRGYAAEPGSAGLAQDVSPAGISATEEILARQAAQEEPKYLLPLLLRWTADEIALSGPSIQADFETAPFRPEDWQSSDEVPILRVRAAGDQVLIANRGRQPALFAVLDAFRDQRPLSDADWAAVLGFAQRRDQQLATDGPALEAAPGAGSFGAAQAGAALPSAHTEQR